MPQPATENEDFDLILRRGRSALDLLVQLQIAPTPARYTVTFLHQTGEMSELSQAINLLVGRNKMTAQALDELYEQFFGRAIEEAELRDASHRIKRTVAEVVDCIDAASGSAEHYGNILAGLSDQSDTQLAADLSGAVANVLDETNRMAETNRKLEARLQASSSEIELLRQHMERLEREASLDALTGIGNRKSFDITLRDAVATANREEQPLCLLMIDIDHFKLFNDTHGHQLGDQVLKLVAKYMTDCIKGLDTACRYGGEEFGVVLPRTRLRDAISVGDLIRQHVAAKKVVNRRTGISLGQITLSVGAAEFRRGEPASDLVHRADEALYYAKQHGRNRVASETDLVFVAPEKVRAR